jgi:glycerol dehydrogenase-like iron-containing ADH family enzyme
MKITVLFESKSGAHVVATFYDDETYMVCLNALQKQAKKNGYIVTESVDYDDEPTEIDNLKAELDNLKAELDYFYGGRK